MTFYVPLALLSIQYHVTTQTYILINDIFIPLLIDFRINDYSCVEVDTVDVYVC